MKKIFGYVFWKTIELVLNFSFLAYLAKIVLPENYSVIAYILIVINVSTFMYSIPTAIYTKYFFKKNEQDLFSFQFFQVFGVFIILLIVILPLVYNSYNLKMSELLYFAVLCFLNIFRVIQQSVLRVELDVKSLSFFNILYPGSLWLMFVLFKSIGIELTAASLLAIYVFSFLIVFIFAFKGLNFGALNFRAMVNAFRFNSLKLLCAYFFIQGGAFVFSYSDRIIVALTQAPESVGGVQFIDNFANIPFMLISMVYFILQPMIMSNKTYFTWLCKYYLTLNIFLLLTFTAIYFSYSILIKWYVFPIYPDYAQMYWIVDFSLATKLFILLAFVPNVYLICCDKERWMISYQWVVVLVGAIIYFLNFDILTIQFIYYVSLFLSFAYFFSALVVSLFHLKRLEVNA